MKSTVALICLLFMPVLAFADISDLFKTTKFQCFLIGILDSENDEGFEFDFPIEINPAARGDHGGPEKTFNYKHHEVVVIADDRWLGLAWWKNGQKLAESITLSTEAMAESRVVLLMNPANDEDRLSLTCNLEN